MARKKNWLERIKRFFSSDTKSKQEKKEKRKVWIYGRVKSRCPPSLPAPSLESSKSLTEAEEAQSKHAVAVAVATAAAANAAIVAAQAAAQVVRLTGRPLSYSLSTDAAAIKIQTAFRALLARRALRALKGLVKLQALIRGQAVRRQTTATLRGLQSLMKFQSHARATRERAAENHWPDEENSFSYGKATGSSQNVYRGWDSSPLSKEKVIILLNNRREAALNRERAKEYAYFHQERRRMMSPASREFEANRRWSWLDQWVGTQPEIFPVDKIEETQLRYLARRSFTQSRTASVKDEHDSFSSSPSLVPSYMASTASAKARFRSLSTPKQRLRTIDSCSEYCAPYTGRLLSPLPSNVSDMGPGRIIRTVKSPRLKGKGEERSNRRLSFESEQSLPNGDQRNVFENVARNLDTCL